MLVGGLAATATAGSRDDGATPQTILLGATAPLSDAQSAAEIRGASAYFRYVNARGGVNGRTITYKVVDDASDAVQAVQATQQLVEEDGVFAIVNALGTEQNLATRDSLNAARVPQLFVGSGATAFGLDHRRYPWTIGFQPSYRAEGWIYGSYVARSRPGAKIAAGKTPTRTVVLGQMRRLNDASNPFLLPGIAVKTSATDPYPIEQAVLQRWSQGRWKRVGGLWTSGAG